MELPHLGKQCGVETCHRLDFLPIRCSDCGGDFCKDHSLPSCHGCVEEDRRKKEEEVPGDVSFSRHPCQFEGCKGGELTPVLCPKCGLNFCLAHRHQADHSCRALTPPDNSTQEATAARIKAITDSMSDGKTKRAPGKRSEQLAAKVQLMKLKQKAEGEKGIPQEDRVYLLVHLPKSSSSSSSSRAVFISRTWSLGRSVDAIATLLKVKNSNNILGAPKLRLFHASTGSLLGRTDQPLQELLAAQTLYSGQSVILEYVEEGVAHLPTHGDYHAG